MFFQDNSCFLDLFKYIEVSSDVYYNMQVGRKAEEGVVVVGVVEVCVELIMVWVLDIIQNLVMLHLRLFKVEILL